MGYTKKNLIGTIQGKFENLIYKNNHTCCPEINFLCVHKKLRNLNLAPILISKITKEVLENYSVNHAIFTIGVPIKNKYYSEKNYYHRCINIDKLVNGNFIEIPKYQVPLYKQHFTAGTILNDKLKLNLSLLKSNFVRI